MNRMFTHRPSEELALEPMSPRDHQHHLLDEALSDLAHGWHLPAVMHLAQALHRRAMDENDLQGVRLSKKVMEAVGPGGLRP